MKLNDAIARLSRKKLRRPTLSAILIAKIIRSYLRMSELKYCKREQ